LRYLVFVFVARFSLSGDLLRIRHRIIIWGFPHVMVRVPLHSQALKLQGKCEFHKGLKVIGCCLGSFGKTGKAHPHLDASLAHLFVVKFKLHSCLHSFQEYFSWQTKSRNYDWNNSISD